MNRLLLSQRTTSLSYAKKRPFSDLFSLTSDIALLAENTAIWFTPKNLKNICTRLFGPVMTLWTNNFKILGSASDLCIFHYLHISTKTSVLKNRCARVFCYKDTLKVRHTRTVKKCSKKRYARIFWVNFR